MRRDGLEAGDQEGEDRKKKGEMKGQIKVKG